MQAIRTRATQLVGRRMMSIDSMTAYNRPSRINAVREQFHQSHVRGANNPTYLKHKGDGIYVAIAFGGFLTGITCVLNGVVDMMLGNKLK